MLILHRTQILPAIASAFAFAALVGCGSSSTSGGTGSSSSSAAVSFATDVMPVLQASCSAGGVTCHGDPSDPTATQPRPYYGPMSGAPSAALSMMVYGTIVNQKSVEDPTMNYVTPNDTAHSYLWQKLYGNLSSLASQCTMPVTASAPCGAAMPIGLPLASDQELFTNWINQGAQP